MKLRWATDAGLAIAGLLGAIGGCSSQPSSGDNPVTQAEPVGTADDKTPLWYVKDPGPRGGPPGAGAPPTSQPVNPNDPAAQEQASVACFPGLKPSTLLFCEQAVIRFQEIDSVQGTIGVETGIGLGPTFDGNSCALCHAEPWVLGSSPGLNSPQHPVVNPVIALAKLDGANNFVPFFIKPDGPVREARSPTDNLVRPLYTISGRVDAPGCVAKQPDFAGLTAFRIPPQLFGLGLVENVPDATLKANLAVSAPMFDTGGEFNIAADGTISRFGWKAQLKSLLIFSANAYNVEQGVTNEGNPNEKVDSAKVGPTCLDYTAKPEDATDVNVPPGDTISDVSSDVENFTMAARLSHAPVPGAPPFKIDGVTITHREIDLGSKLFDDVGCVACHTATLKTTVSSIDPAMSNYVFHPYSDFAIHHMGPKLADGITQGNAGPDQFRTAPLWGVGQRLFLLHDGRTSDLTAAILAHGGDAAKVIDNFMQLSKTEQRDVIYFLRSL